MPRKSRSNSSDTLVSVSIFADVDIPDTPDVQLVEHAESCAAAEAAAALDAGAQQQQSDESDRAAGGGGGGGGVATRSRRSSNEVERGAAYPDDRRYDPTLHTGGVAEYDFAAAAERGLASKSGGPGGGGRSNSLDTSNTSRGVAGAAPWRSSGTPYGDEDSSPDSQKKMLHSSVTADDTEHRDIMDASGHEDGGAGGQHKRHSSLLSRFDMDLTGQFDESWQDVYNTAQVREKSMGKYPETPDLDMVKEKKQQKKGRNLLVPMGMCLIATGAIIGAAVAVGKNAGGGSTGGGGTASAAETSGILDAIGLGGLTAAAAAEGSLQEAETHNSAPASGTMPFPVDANNSNPKPYTGAFPHSLADVVESSSPRFGGEEIPFVFEMTSRGGGGTGTGEHGVLEQVLGQCYGLVGAAEQAPGREKEWKKGQQLEVVNVGGLPYLNVDLSQPSGIDRAALLDVASSTSPSVDYLASSRVHRASDALLSTLHRGRMIAVLRHPVDAAVARYYERRAAGDKAVASLRTLEEYASSDAVEGNAATAHLSGRSSDAAADGSAEPLSRTHVDLAMEVLRRKALVVLYENAEESLARAEAYLGLDGAAGPNPVDCRAEVLNDIADREAELARKLGNGQMPQKNDPVYLQLAEKNKFDMELYEYARNLLFPAQARLSVRDAEPFNEKKYPPNRNCVENGRFNGNPPGINWFPVQAQLRVVKGRDSKGNALQAVNRGHQIFGGMWQNIETGCLRIGEWYEVRATVRATMRDTGNAFRCDPTILFNNVPQSCPAVGIRVGVRRTEVALTVGPTGGGDWTETYGVFRATSEMLASGVSLFVSRAPPDVDLTVDAVSLAPARRDAVGLTDCSNPIANGNAEAGDHRFWFIRGAKGGGQIEMVSPGYGGSKYAFRHAGAREQRYRGMLHRLDASCFVEGTTWTITARFRYYSVGRGGKGVQFAACRKDNPKAKNSCPVFDMDFISPNGAQINTGPLPNEAKGEVKTGGAWSEIRHTVTVSSDMALRPQVLLYVNSVDPDYNYDLDDITMVRS